MPNTLYRNILDMGNFYLDVPKVILSLPFGDPPLNQHIFDSSSASSEHQYLLFMFGHIAAELSQSMEFLLLVRIACDIGSS